ncbi:MAG: hypothetical protein ACLFT8_02035 [Desulfovermiculus sp.]
MHKDLFGAMIFCCLVVACAPLEKDIARPTQDFPTTVWQESATVEVSLDSRKIQAGEEPEDLLQDRGLQQGVGQVISTWLNQRLLFREQRLDLPEENATSFVRVAQDGKAVYTRDTDMYTQRFEVLSQLKPQASMRGKITGLENERTIVGSHDHVLIQGHNWTSQAQDAFFVVARTAHEVDGDVLRLIGYGRIHNIQDWMAQGRILEANLEVMAGDYVYPVWVSSRSVEVPRTPAEIENSVEEVVVESKPRSSQQISVQERPLPAETK